MQLVTHSRGGPSGAVLLLVALAVVNDALAIQVRNGTWSGSSTMAASSPRVPTGFLRHRSQVRGHTSSQAFNSTLQGESPRVFFLFLTRHGVTNHLWRQFFLSADKTKYRNLMHCKDWKACHSRDNELHVGGDVTVVSTVPSSYCTDLVSPMVQLLKTALGESRSDRDKFVFLSESTLPVKPFHEVFDALTASTDSDFCIYPESDWVSLDLTKPGHRAMLVKHSQWMVLNRPHASNMVAGWPAFRSGIHRRPWEVPAGSDAMVSANEGLPLPQCLDEWAMFATLYGSVILDVTDRSPRWFSGLSAGPFSLKLWGPEQGTCRTFAWWRTHEGSAGALAEDMVGAGGATFSCYPTCPTTHPAEFVRLSDAGMRMLRQSPFLFARKFREDVPTLEQFSRIVLN